MNLTAIQSALREATLSDPDQHLDGWLFYDHHRRDPIAYRILGLDEHSFVSRRWFYFIPAHGEPEQYQCAVSNRLHQRYRLQCLHDLSGCCQQSRSIFTGTFTNVSGLAVDPAGNVYLGNTGGSSVLRFAAGTWTQSTVASGFAPGGLGTDSSGNLYVADTTNQRIVEYLRGTPVASPSTTVGNTSTETAYTVENDGNTSATITAVTAAGAAIAGPSTTCSASATVAVDATCVLSAEFQATAGTSPQSGTVTMTGNFPAAAITVSGNATNDPSKLAFTTPPPGTLIAGSTPGRVVVALQTSTGTTSAYDTTAPVTLTVTGPSSYSATYGPTSASSAVASFFPAAPTAIGTYTYTASSSGLTSATASETTTVGPVATLAIVPASSSASAGVVDSVTVTGRDAYGNLSNATDTIALTSTDSTAFLPVNFALSSGTSTQPVTFNQAGTFTVTASDVTHTTVPAATSGNIAVANFSAIYTVTVSSDDPLTATAGNCTNQALSGATLDANCSLRDAFAAVSALNTTSALPAINFASSVYGQTITLLTSGITVTGSFDLIGPGLGTNAITLSGNNLVSFVTDSTSGTTILISGLKLTAFTAASGSVLSPGSSTVTLVNDVFTSNKATGTTGGGVLYQTAGTLTVTGCTFTSNTTPTGPGGAIRTAATSTFTGDTFTSNAVGTTTTTTSANYGGALYLAAASSIGNSTFTGNSITNTAVTVYGGAIYTPSALTLTSDIFTSNTATTTAPSSTLYAYAGAVYAIGGSTITGCSFLNNTAMSTGTYSYAVGGGFYGSAPIISNSLFSGNIASGAAYSASGGLTATGTSKFTNVTITGNTASTASSAGSVGGGTQTTAATLYNVTITNNSARTAGGLYRSGPGSSLTMYNTVISGNTATAYADTNNTFTSTTSYVDTSTTTTCTVNCTPLLSALGNYGGPVQTMVPLPGSPLIAAGTNSTTALNSATTDARGYPRTTTYNGTTYVDIGAVQTNYSLDFMQQPPATTVKATSMAPSPTAQVYESGVALNATPAAGSGTLTLTATAGTPTYTATLANSGLATFSALQFPEPEDNDILTALIQSSATTPIPVASATSSSFNITDTGPTIGFATLPASVTAVNSTPGTITVQMLTSSTGSVYTAGADTIQITLTGPSGFTPVTASVAAVNGVATFSSTSAPSLAGANLSPIGTYTYTASDISASPYTTDTIAIPETVTATVGYIWLVNGNATVSRVSQSGTSLTNSGTAASTSSRGGVAFDSSANIWSVTNANNVLSFTTSTGASPTTYSGGGLNAPVSVAVDGAGYIWIANSGNNSIAEFNNAGTAQSVTSTGYSGVGTLSGSTATVSYFATPSAIVLDTAGGIWVTNKSTNSITHVFGAATPVTTPLSQAVSNNTVATKP
jgi:hypothetical protein